MDKQRESITGFTLIEVMLVLVVMAVMASLLTASISDNPGRQLDREAKRLQALINLIAEEAVMQGVEFSLILNSQPDAQGVVVSGYQFAVLNPDDLSWQSINEVTYRFHPFPAGISIDLALDGDNRSDRALLDRQAELIRSSNTSTQLQPALLLLSSGEMTPFTMLLRHTDLEQVVTLVGDGISGVERR
jgi:general secretion pathway protein H